MPEVDVIKRKSILKEYELVASDDTKVVTKQPANNEGVGSTSPVPLGYEEVTLKCNGCKKTVTTITRYHITDKTHLCVCCISMVTWPFGGCFLAGLPYCLKWCQKVEHRCPNCNHMIGSYARF